MKLVLAVCALLASTSCRTLETRQLSSSPAPVVQVGKRARTWEVRCENEPIGAVVLFQQLGSVRDSVYIVRNPWNQDLGLIDGLGRAYCYLPHEEEPTWVGSGTVAVGAQHILGAGSVCTLVELAELPNDSGPGSGSIERVRDESARKPPESASSTPPRKPSDATSPDGGLPQSR